MTERLAYTIAEVAGSQAMTDDPLKQTPACELDRDNRTAKAMTQDRCEYCGQEDRYGHNAICVMSTVEELRAQVERLRAWAADEQRGRHKAEEDRMNARSEIERLTAAVRDAHKLIDNELVGPWVAAHKLDDVLGDDPKP